MAPLAKNGVIAGRYPSAGRSVGRSGRYCLPYNCSSDFLSLNDKKYAYSSFYRIYLFI